MFKDVFTYKVVMKCLCTNTFHCIENPIRGVNRLNLVLLMVSASVLVMEQRNKQCCAPVNLEFTSAYSVRGLAVTNCNGGPKLTHMVLKTV